MCPIHECAHLRQLHSYRPPQDTCTVVGVSDDWSLNVHRAFHFSPSNVPHSYTSSPLFFSRCFFSFAVSSLRRLASEVIRSKRPGGLAFDIFGFKPPVRDKAAPQKLPDRMNAVLFFLFFSFFANALYLSQSEQDFLF